MAAVATSNWRIARSMKRSQEAGTRPHTYAFLLESVATKLRWLVSDQSGQIFGFEIHFIDGSRARGECGTGTKGLLLELRPESYSDDALAVTPRDDA